MSLLLDALKQAAQEKKHRDALLAQTLLDGDDENQSSPSSEPELVKVQDEVDFNDVDASKEGVDTSEENALSLETELIEYDEFSAFDLSDDDNDSRESNDFLEGFVVRPDQTSIVDQEIEIEETLELEEVVLWDEQSEKVDESQVSEPVSQPPVEPDIPATNTANNEEKRKAAIVKLVALRQSAEKQKLVKGGIVAGLTLLISGLSLFFYYTWTADKTQQSLAVSETFDQYVDEVTSLSPESPIASVVVDSEAIVPESDTVKTSETVSKNAPIESYDEVVSNTVSAMTDTIVKKQNDKTTKEQNDKNVAESNDEIAPADINDNSVDPFVESSLVEDDLEPAVVSYEDDTDVVFQNNAATVYVQPGKKRVDKTSRLVQQAYTAYQKGQLDIARKLYDQALLAAPEKRDALLGAAAVAMRQDRQQDALLLYQKLLSVFPQDSYGKAGLLSLQAANIKDPQWLSQVNQLLLTHPDDAHLHFLKANANAINGRWQAAQQSYFDAWSRDKTNPDYAYNLAISLDQLGQPSAALNYYRQALALSKIHPSNIVMQDLRRRIAELDGGQ